jgi:hypothetical protein
MLVTAAKALLSFGNSAGSGVPERPIQGDGPDARSVLADALAA